MAKESSTKKHGYAVEECLYDSLGDIQGCHIIGDTIISANGTTAQIDNIIISPRAIYIIEMKSIRYSVVGKVRDRKWTFYSTRSSGIIVENPLYQNHKHILVFKDLLSKYMKSIPPIINIVCIGGNPKARIITDSSNVCKIATLRYHLIKDCKSPLFNADKCFTAIKRIIEESGRYGK